MKTNQHKAKRVPAGEGGGYDYRGYRLQHPENEDGTENGDWDIFEKVSRTDWNTGDCHYDWIAFDRVSQLWVAKEWIDQWVQVNA